MKKVVRDILIYFFSYSGIAWWYRTRRERSGPLVRVLCFHDVPDREWFAAVLDEVTAKHVVVTPDQFEKRDFCAGNSYILLTFDDGYQSWVDVVVPVLEERGLKGLFFVNSGLLDTADDEIAQAHYVAERLRVSPKRTLSWSQLSLITAAGHTIGGHSTGHYDMTTLTAADVKREVVEDKAAIETHLAVSIGNFAYPFGTRRHYNADMNKIVSAAGYSYAFTAETGYITDSHVIPRTLVEGEQSTGSLRCWLGGGYDIFRALYGRIS